jgi:uncharacterized protein involved in exopolysaccharide biosynthesis
MDGVATRPWERRPTLPTVAGYFALVGSRAALIAVTTCLGALVGVFLAVRQAPIYQASVAIELPSVPTWVSLDPEADPAPATTIDSTAELVYSTPVVDRVAAATSLSTQQVSDGLGVSAYPLSRVLVTSFRAHTAALAVTGADQAAAALMAQRRVVLEGHRFLLATRLRRYLSHLLPESNRKAGAYNPVSRRLLAEQAQIDAVRQQAASGRAMIIQPATPATSVRSPGEVPIATGGMLGLLCGVGYASWSSARRRSGAHLSP